MPAPITDPRQLRHAALDAIRADPGSWNQGVFRCSSGMCFAGHAAALAGGVFPYADTDSTSAIVQNGDGQPVTSVHSEIVVGPDGVSYTIEFFAARALALPEPQADVLFAPSNTLTELTHLVARLDADDPITFSDIDPDFDDDLDEDDDDPEEGLGSL